MKAKETFASTFDVIELQFKSNKFLQKQFFFVFPKYEIIFSFQQKIHRSKVTGTKSTIVEEREVWRPIMWYSHEKPVTLALTEMYNFMHYLKPVYNLAWLPYWGVQNDGWWSWPGPGLMHFPVIFSEPLHHVLDLIQARGGRTPESCRSETSLSSSKCASTIGDSHSNITSPQGHNYYKCCSQEGGIPHFNATCIWVCPQPNRKC